MSPMRMLSFLTQRACATFLLKDRIEEYEKLLRSLFDAGYRSLTLRDLARLNKSGADATEPTVLLRHDIDSDPSYVEKWLAVEKKYRFCASYYFRLRTFDPLAMKRIEDSGAEASYHFEELSSLIRRQGRWKGPITPDFVAEARFHFRRNFRHLRSLCGLPMQTVAAHGDFVNRRLGVTNSILLAERDMREELGIMAEAYDRSVVGSVTARFSDCMERPRWRSRSGGSLGAAILHRSRFVEILTHPRHWRANIFSNVWEDGDRAIMTVFSRIGVPAGRVVDIANRFSYRFKES